MGNGLVWGLVGVWTLPLAAITPAPALLPLPSENVGLILFTT